MHMHTLLSLILEPQQFCLSPRRSSLVRTNPGSARLVKTRGDRGSPANVELPGNQKVISRRTFFLGVLGGGGGRVRACRARGVPQCERIDRSFHVGVEMDVIRFCQGYTCTYRFPYKQACPCILKPGFQDPGRSQLFSVGTFMGISTKVGSRLTWCPFLFVFVFWALFLHLPVWKTTSFSLRF